MQQHFRTLTTSIESPDRDQTLGDNRTKTDYLQFLDQLAQKTCEEEAMDTSDLPQTLCKQSNPFTID